jgi:hypothetical protein
MTQLLHYEMPGVDKQVENNHGLCHTAVVVVSGIRITWGCQSLSHETHASLHEAFSPHSRLALTAGNYINRSI